MKAAFDQGHATGLQDAAEIADLVVFLDADDEVLRRRFTETRRRHPLAVDRPVLDGILAERSLLSALRDHADLALDSTATSGAELRRLVQEGLAEGLRAGLVIAVLSFAYRWGLPREPSLRSCGWSCRGPASRR